MGGHHHARDDRTVSVWRLLPLFLELAGKRHYGEVRIRFRDGEVVGQVKVERDYLVEDLMEPTSAQIQEALRKGVECQT